MEERHALGTRFPGLKLTESERSELNKICKNQQLKLRIWRRAKVLQFLDDGWKMSSIRKATGTYDREIRRVGWRYLEKGFKDALTDEPMPRPSKTLDHRYSSAIIAMVCSEPPAGYSRWTVELITVEVIKRGIIDKISREPIRLLLKEHDLKPWRKKNVVRPKIGRRIH